VTQAADDGFQLVDALPAMIGAGIGGGVAILSAVLTQTWQSRRDRHADREKSVAAAIDKYLDAVEGHASKQDPAQVAAFNIRGAALYGAARRAGYVLFAEALSELNAESREARHRDDGAGQIRVLNCIMSACAVWNEDPRAFERRANPWTLERLKGMTDKAMRDNKLPSADPS